MIMDIMYYGWILIQVIVGYNLVLPLILSVVYFFVKALSREKFQEITKGGKEADYGIIVTAYEQTDLLPSVVNSLLKLNYSNYLIYIVADNCDISNLHFDSDKVVLLRPDKVIANNVGSHFYAIHRFKRKHERITIIDSDNLVHPDYLNKLNVYFDKGYKAVQGVRAPKNLNTMYACLDAARDKYYHYYDSKVLFGAGASATLAGSGMAFETALYSECLDDGITYGAGFDKVLQYKLVEKGERIAFYEDAIVYDEKTSVTDQLVKQRARWINTWFKYFTYGFDLIGKGILKLNWNMFLYGVVLVRPPLFIFLLLSVLFMAANLFIAPAVAMIWFIGLALFVTSFFVALLSSKTDKRIYRSLAGIPRFMFLQLISLTKSRKAYKLSVATKHQVNETIV
jgi:cellulose synthase/poly-beta-1,6-N-acetylglucosamine synthase-like glycosyltransferase